jgi:hypothetical protein
MPACASGCPGRVTCRHQMRQMPSQSSECEGCRFAVLGEGQDPCRQSPHTLHAYLCRRRREHAGKGSVDGHLCDQIHGSAMTLHAYRQGSAVARYGFCVGRDCETLGTCSASAAWRD